MKRLIACLLTVILIFSCAGVAAADYTGHWAENAIEELINSGVIKGYDGGNVLPDGQLTRAEFAALINRAGGFTEVNAPDFIDVLGDEWFANDLRIARTAGYMQGDDYDRANPYDTISRVEALVMISRAFFPETDVRYEFSDLKEIPEWARQHIMSLAGYGVVKGFDDNSFKPHTPITRGQIFSVVRTIISDAPMVEAARDPEPSEDDHIPKTSSVRDSGSADISNLSRSSTSQSDSAKSGGTSSSSGNDIFDFFDSFNWFDNFGDFGGSSGSNNWDWWDSWSNGGSGSNSNEYGYDSHDEYGYDKHDEYGYKSY